MSRWESEAAPLPQLPEGMKHRRGRVGPVLAVMVVLPPLAGVSQPSGCKCSNSASASRPGRPSPEAVQSRLRLGSTQARTPMAPARGTARGSNLVLTSPTATAASRVSGTVGTAIRLNETTDVTASPVGAAASTVGPFTAKAGVVVRPSALVNSGRETAVDSPRGTTSEAAAIATAAGVTVGPTTQEAGSSPDRMAATSTAWEARTATKGADPLGGPPEPAAVVTRVVTPAVSVGTRP